MLGKAVESKYSQLFFVYFQLTGLFICIAGIYLQLEQALAATSNSNRN